MEWSRNCDFIGNDVTNNVVSTGNITYCMNLCKTNGIMFF